MKAPKRSERLPTGPMSRQGHAVCVVGADPLQGSVQTWRGTPEGDHQAAHARSQQNAGERYKGDGHRCSPRRMRGRSAWCALRRIKISEAM